MPLYVNLSAVFLQGGSFIQVSASIARRDKLQTALPVLLNQLGTVLTYKGTRMFFANGQKPGKWVLILISVKFCITEKGI